MILFDCIVLWGWVVSTAFPLIYARNRPWSSNLPARSAFTFSVIVAAVMSLVAFRVIFGLDLPDWVRFAVYVAIAIGSTFQTAVLIRTQRRDGKKVSA